MLIAHIHRLYMLLIPNMREYRNRMLNLAKNWLKTKRGAVTYANYDKAQLRGTTSYDVNKTISPFLLSGPYPWAELQHSDL